MFLQSPFTPRQLAPPPRHIHTCRGSGLKQCPVVWGVTDNVFGMIVSLSWEKRDFCVYTMYVWVITAQQMKTIHWAGLITAHLFTLSLLSSITRLLLSMRPMKIINVPRAPVYLTWSLSVKIIASCWQSLGMLWGLKQDGTDALCLMSASNVALTTPESEVMSVDIDVMQFYY